MDTNTTRTLLADGNLYTLLDGLAPDRREDFVLLSHDVDEPSAPVTLLSVGASLMLMSPQGLRVIIHDHPELPHEECWERIAAHLRDKVVAFNATMTAVRADAEAQSMIHAGIPAPMVLMGLGYEMPGLGMSE